MLEILKEKNPSLSLLDVTHPDFSRYGRIVSMDTAEILSVADMIERLVGGAKYVASLAEFESLSIHKEIQEKIFGTLPTQTGYCYGECHTLNATEWHHSSELNIAITPLILILGKRADIRDGVLDSGNMKAFYLPRGVAVEVYADTTHYCPIQVMEGGFGAVVALPKDTNTPLDVPVSDPLLFAQNKWLIAHKDASALLAKGARAGIVGENYTVKY